MPSVSFYFQVHQPIRLKSYSCFQVGHDHEYFDNHCNREIMQKVAKKCYIPTNRAILNLINRHQGRFRVSYSITGVAIEQMMEYAPEALQTFIDLARTGCVEFLGETYYHSLSSIYDPEEFKQQVGKHAALMESLFGQRPKVFRNTELICSDRVIDLVSQMGYKAMIAEGADDILQWRSPNYIYEKPGQNIRLLLKNYGLSDDIAFRFSNHAWRQYPLTASKYANWIHSLTHNSNTINLFMDYETFGEHQWESTGIFGFLDQLPSEILKHSDWNFLTPSEVVDRYPVSGGITFPREVSWADMARDLSAWQGNHMQRSALAQIYAIGQEVRSRNNPSTLDLWRKLQTSDHFYYMYTKWTADGLVHTYFNHYRSPYEAFINYMNVISDFRGSVLGYRAPMRTA